MSIESQEYKRPGLQREMKPQPVSIAQDYRPSKRLENKVAIITGGDSGIGRAIALHYASESISALFLTCTPSEKEDMEECIREIKKINTFTKVETWYGDFARDRVEEVVEKCKERFGRIDILVSNAAEQFQECSVQELDVRRMEHLFRVNVFPLIRLVKAAEPHMQPNSCVIVTTSVISYKGSSTLLDYAASKGALVALIRSLALSLHGKKIRVNGVAPGPIWTPLVSSSLNVKMDEFGTATPLERCGQPSEVAPAYVFLADNSQSSYYTGQVLHPNGGYIVNA